MGLLPPFNCVLMCKNEWAMVVSISALVTLTWLSPYYSSQWLRHTLSPFRRSYESPYAAVWMVVMWAKHSYLCHFQLQLMCLTCVVPHSAYVIKWTLFMSDAATFKMISQLWITHFEPEMNELCEYHCLVYKKDAATKSLLSLREALKHGKGFYMCHRCPIIFSRF